MLDSGTGRAYARTFLRKHPQQGFSVTTNREQKPDPTSMTLLHAAQSDKPGAWDLMVRIYGPIVFRNCRKMGLSQDDAPDVVQDVFRKLLKHLPKFERQRTGSFRKWLAMTTRTTVIDFCRANGETNDAIGGSAAIQYFQTIPEIIEDESALSSSRPSKLRDALHDALAMIREEFSEHVWTAFWRTAVDGQNAREVAEELDMGHTAVRMAKSRVLSRLKELIGDSESDDDQEGPAND